MQRQIRHIEPHRRAEAPVVAGYLVERLVVERSHELCVGRRAVGSENGHAPFLFLPRSETVAERCPLHLQLRVGHRAPYRNAMCMTLTFLDPCKQQGQTVAILFIVCKLAVYQCIADVGAAALYDGVTRYNGVYDVHILVGRTHLHRHRTTVGRERFGRNIEPVAGVGRRYRVVKSEDNEVLFQRISLADSLKPVPA